MNRNRGFKCDGDEQGEGERGLVEHARSATEMGKDAASEQTK